MVEFIACPNCKRQLQVPDQYLGETVQCPECRHMFTASSVSVSAKSSGGAPSDQPRRPLGEDDPQPRRRHYEEDDDFDVHRGRRLGQFYAPHRGGVILTLGLISLVGGLSLIGIPLLIGPVAWGMGSYDLREIREGRMDPSGESMTRTGQVLGIIATVLLLLIGGCICLGVMMENGRF